MKSFTIFSTLVIIAIALIAQGSSYLYAKKDPYSEFLNKNHEFGDRHVSGFNLKITEEMMNTLSNKLKNELDRDGEGDGDRLLLQDDDDSDEFEQIDLTDYEIEGNMIRPDTPEKSSSEESMELADIKLTAKVGKREFTYSKIFTTAGKGHKSFSKLYQHSRDGGEVSSEISGSLNTTLTSSTTGEIDSKTNTTVWSKGKDYHSSLTATSKIDKTSAEKKSGKRGDKIGSSSTLAVASTLKVDNMTMEVQTTLRTKAETFRAPFGIYLTLFDAKLNVTGEATEGGDIRGEVTSRVVFAKKDRSLTKSTIRGYVVYEMESPSKACGVTFFKARSHTWTKIVRANNEPDSVSYSESGSDENMNKDVTVEVYTSTKTRVYGKAGAKGVKVFYGSGVVTFQKAEVSIPTMKSGAKVPEHEYGVNYVVKEHLTEYLSSVRHLSSSIMGL